MTAAEDTENTPKAWIRLTISCDDQTADKIAAFLVDLTGGGIEQVSAAPPDTQEKIIGYFPEDDNWPTRQQEVRNFLTRLQTSAPSDAPADMSTEIIQNQDWNSTWKAGFKPFAITPHLVIKPSWEPYTPGKAEKVIELDPGMAFGTGHHASTKLALQLIEDLFHRGNSAPLSVLDVGTGTGILAMASALFGARRTLGIDNDPEAVTVGRENVEQNNLQDLVTINGTPLEDLPDPYDLVIANIIHNTLVAMAPALAQRVAPGGSLILAGILSGEQTKNIGFIYSSLGLQQAQVRNEGEWSALLFTKK